MFRKFFPRIFLTLQVLYARSELIRCQYGISANMFIDFSPLLRPDPSPVSFQFPLARYISLLFSVYQNQLLRDFCMQRMKQQWCDKFQFFACPAPLSLPIPFVYCMNFKRFPIKDALTVEDSYQFKVRSDVDSTKYT